MSAVAQFRGVVVSEWIKLRGLRSVWVSLAAGVAMMVLMGSVLSLSLAASAANGYDVVMAPHRVAADSMILAQLPLVVVAASVMTGEYGRATVRSALRAVPRRGTLLLAKTAVAVLFTAGSGLLLGALGVGVAAVLLDGARLEGTDRALGAVVGIAVSTGLLGAVAVGAGAMLRSTVVTLLAMLLLVLAAPLLLEISATEASRAVRDVLPSTAVQVLRTGEPEPYSSGLALVVLVAWTAVAQLGGYALLWWRDA